MSLVFYKLLHILGLLLVFQSLGAAWTIYISGSTLAASSQKKMLMSMHGIGAFLLLLGGFGMAAKLEIMAALPLWLWVKVAIWLVLGFSLTLVKKKPESAKMWWSLSLILGLVAAFLGLFKPF